MKDFQYITNSSPAYIESLYQDYVKNPESIDSEITQKLNVIAAVAAKGKLNAA